MKHFVTLFPEAENVHLIKDVGQIPFQMQKHFDYTSTLACYNNGDYPYLNKEADGLNIDFMEDTGKRFFFRKAALRYVFQNAEQIDVLNLYHMTQETMLLGLTYKRLNPKGVLYLKLDLAQNQLTEDKQFIFSTHPLKEKVHQRMFKRFARKADIISVETEHVKQQVEHIFEPFDKELLLLTNGLDHQFVKRHRAGFKPASNKENIILTVGRIGSPEKNHVLLLKALSEIDLSNWEVYFVGAVEEAFQPKIDAFFCRRPEYKEKVHFTGEVTNREKLFNYYARAKIFCMTSQRESFGFAMLEALSMGNYLIGADSISSIKALTNNGQFGHIVPSNDAKALQNALQEVMAEDFYNEELAREIMRYSDKYNWKEILKKLDKAVTQKALKFPADYAD